MFNDSLPIKVKKDHLRGYGSDAVMTTATAKLSAATARERVIPPTNAQLTNLSQGTPQRSGAPCFRRGYTRDNGCQAQRGTHSPTPQSAPPASLFPANIFLPAETCLSPSWQAHRHQGGRATAAGRQPLLIPYGWPRDDPEGRTAPLRTPGASTAAHRLWSWIP